MKKVPKKPKGPTYRLPSIQQGELLHKLYAVAHFKAEVLRAKIEGRTVNLQTATANFNVNPCQWGRAPRTVCVIWSHQMPEGGREFEWAELSYKSMQ